MLLCGCVRADFKTPVAILVGFLFIHRVSSIIRLSDINNCPGDHHWPLTRIENGQFVDAAFNANATVIGAGVTDELGVLSIVDEGYVDVGNYSGDCVSDPAKCLNGLTVSFWLRHRGIISIILSFHRDYHSAVNNWLSAEVPKNSRWVPCFRASTSKWNGTEFHANCDNKGPTVTIIKVRDFVFGGFLSASWDGTANGSLSSQGAFLFSLSNPEGRSPFKLPLYDNEMAKAAYSTPTSMPSFGGTAGDLVLTDVDANINTLSSTNPGTVFGLPSGIAAGSTVAKNLLSGSHYFLPDEVEVFYNQVLTTARNYIITSGPEEIAYAGFAMYSNYNSSSNNLSYVIQVEASTKRWILQLDSIPEDWYHVTYTWNSTAGIQYYENGTLIELPSIVDTIEIYSDSATRLLIGNSTRSASGQSLQMYGLTIWRAVITDEEIKAFMNSVCSPITDEVKDDFNWSRVALRTPTSATGPTSFVYLPRTLPTDFYINFTAYNVYTEASLDTVNDLYEFTACWWARTSASSYEAVTEVLGRNGARLGVLFYSKSIFVSTTSWNSSETSIAMKNGGWNHMCVTWQNTLLTIYLDSRVVYSDHLSAPLTFIIPFKVFIGKSTQNFAPYRGDLSGYNFWDRLLSSSEIQIIAKGCSLVGGNLLRWSHIGQYIQGGWSKSALTQCERDYLFVEASFPQRKGRTARLATSQYIPMQINCLQFYYNFNGQDIGRLNVYMQSYDRKEQLLWSLAGDQGDMWRLVSLPLNILGKGKVIFEGIVGDGYRGDLAIDKVTLSTSPSCSGGTGKSFNKIEGLESNIVGHIKNYTNEIQTWMTDAGFSNFWTPCHSLSRNGWPSAEKLHMKCAQKGPTITIIRYLGNIFGGFYDQSWKGFGQCTNKTTLPSNKAFLFSLNSSVGDYPLKMPIRDNATWNAFDCRSTNYFPKFGDDLVFNLVNQTIDATVGTTFTFIRTTSFINNAASFVPTDFEILVPKVTFCKHPCPLNMICNELRGQCECDPSSRFSEDCQGGISIQNFTADAYDLYPFDFPFDLKNMIRPKWGLGINNPERIKKGIRGGGISTKENSSITMEAHACLLNPGTCSSGITTMLWLRYHERNVSEPAIIFCSGSCGEDDFGVQIDTTPNQDELVIQVTKHSGRCRYKFDCVEGVWTHIAFTLSSTSTLVIYKNGAQVTFLNESCYSQIYTDKGSSSFIQLGQTGPSDFDDFIVFPMILTYAEIQKLLEFYKGRKNTQFEMTFWTTSLQWNPVTFQDKENVDYKSQIASIETSVNSLYSSTGGSVEGSPPYIMSFELMPANVSGASNLSTQISLRLQYNAIGYNTVKSLVTYIETEKRLAQISVDDVVMMALDTVYTLRCNICSVVVVGNTAILHWTEYVDTASAGRFQGYNLEILNMKTFAKATIVLASGKTFTNVTTLKGVTSYNISVAPFSLQGTGRWSEPVSFTTEDMPPQRAPDNITAEAVSPSKVKVTWNQISQQFLPSQLLGYRILYRTVGSSLELNTTVLPNKTVALVEGLSVVTSYNVCVQGFTSFDGPRSRFIEVTTLEDVPSEGPENASANALNDTAIRASWGNIPPDKRNGIITQYFVTYNIFGGSDMLNVTVNAGTNEVYLTHLLPYKEYTIAIHGSTVAGIGNTTVILKTRTQAGVPTGAPENINNNFINATVIRLTWNPLPLELTSGPIKGYFILYNALNGSKQGESTSACTCNTTITLKHLGIFTEYEIKIAAFTVKGNGPWRNGNITTKEGVPISSPRIESAIGVGLVIKITWKPIAINLLNGILRSYLITYKEITNTTSINRTVTAPGSVSKFTIPDLMFLTSYNITLQAVTIDAGPPNGSRTGNTTEDAPSGFPTNVKYISLSTSTLNVSWSPIPTHLAGGVIEGYIVRYQSYYEDPSSSVKMITVNGSATLFYSIEGLQTFTKYNVSLAGFTRVGMGNFSAATVALTAEGTPTVKAENVSAALVSRNSSVIQWTKGLDGKMNGVIQGYKLTVYDSLREINTTVVTCPSASSLVLDELNPFTPYTVNIQIFNSNYNGNSSRAAVFRTEEAAPSEPPSNITSRNTSSSTIFVTFKAPGSFHINGILRGYRLFWFETLSENPEVFNKTIHLPFRGRRSTGGTQQSLTLEGLNKFTMYTIRVLAFTVEDGVFFVLNTTTAQDVPSLPPSDVTASNTSSISINVVWQPVPEGDVNGVLRGYHVFYQNASASGETPLVVIVDHNTLNVHLRNLSKFTEYLISVAAFTEPGTGNVSTILHVFTDEDLPGKPPTLLAGHPLNTTVISMNWKPVIEGKRNGIILGYTLRVQSLTGGLIFNITISNATVLTTEVGGLQSWTNYSVRINAFTMKGPGPWSKEIILTTLEETPLASHNISISNITSTTITVKWQAIDVSVLRGVLRGYRVVYTPNSTVFPNVTLNITTHTRVLEAVVTGLHKFTEYNIYVVGFTIADGISSQVLTAKTETDVPTVGPSDLSQLSASSTSVLISFNPIPPEHANGVITGYMVTYQLLGSSDPPTRIVLDPTATSATISKLSPLSKYMIKVMAKTAAGYGASSNVTVETGPVDSRSNPATRFSVDSIPMSWDPISSISALGKVLGYRVRYQLITLGGEPVEGKPVKEIHVTMPSINLTHLETYGGYIIMVAAITARGIGPEKYFSGETCRCRRRLTTNWRKYNPYVDTSQENGEPEGIIPAVIREMAVFCCELCSTHGPSYVDFNTSLDGSPAEQTNEVDLLGNITEDADFSFPVYGQRNQLIYKPGFGFRALVESPGVVYVVFIANGLSPAQQTINSLLSCLPYILLTVLIAYIAGFIMWVLDRRSSPDYFPLSFIKGTYEGTWWSFITMTTLGYGDRYPTSVVGKSFAILWMMMGIVIYGILNSYLQSALTTWTINIDKNSYGAQIIAIHNSPEHRLGVRLNSQINTESQPKNFEELYQALLNKKAYGALIDAYAIGNQKHLFEDPNLKIAKVFDFKSAYGIVLGGTSTRMKKCFYEYIQMHKAKIFKRIEKYVRFLEVKNDLPLTVEYSSGLFSADTPMFVYTLLLLTGVLLMFLVIGGCWELGHRKERSKQEKKGFCTCGVYDLKDDVQGFVSKMRDTSEKLRQKHIHQLLTHAITKKRNGDHPEYHVLDKRFLNNTKIQERDDLMY